MRRQLRAVGSVCLVPWGVEVSVRFGSFLAYCLLICGRVQDGVNEVKIPDEELERLANYQLKVSCNSDGSRLKIDLDWDEDEVMAWLQTLVPHAYEWITDEIAGTEETRWCLFARRKHSKYHLVSEQHPDLACSASYIYGTLNTGYQASSRIVFGEHPSSFMIHALFKSKTNISHRLVSSIPIPEKVYRKWQIGSSRKRAAESEEGSDDMVSGEYPGLHS